jgi:NodT family efflux transporter outer membrane factor (OMF) lipoprotein
MGRSRSRSSISACAAYVLLAVGLTGCAAGPDYPRPEPAATVMSYAPSPPGAQAPQTPDPGDRVQHFTPADTIAPGWWHRFGSAALDRLVQEALADSPTLAQARQRLEQARQDYLAQAGGTQWPQVNANVGVTRQKVDPAAFIGGSGPFANSSVPPFTLYNAQVSVSYTLDLFGTNRRELEALAAEVGYQQYQLEAARLSLAGNVVTTAIRRASLARQLALTTQLLANQQQQLDITSGRYRAGGVSGQDLHVQRTQLEQTRALLAPLRTQLAQTDHQLAVYLGRAPAELTAGGDDPGALELDTLALPDDVPLTLPSNLARQRPDIRAAEALLHQASANVGVATANLYPQITLSASGGKQGLSVSDLVNVWSIGAGLTQPLFHGGQLRARKRSAEAAYEAAVAGYRQTTLSGLQQVADALEALQQDALELQARDRAQRDAHANAGIAAERQAAGGVSQLAVLDAEHQDLQASLDRTQMLAQRLADTAALFQALGAQP